MADFPAPPWQDLSYWQKRKKNRWRKLASPSFTVPVVDTHCHLNSLRDPAYAIARCACVGVAELCTIVDPTEADPTIDQLGLWMAQASKLVPELISSESKIAGLELGVSFTSDEYSGYLNDDIIDESKLSRMPRGTDKKEESEVFLESLRDNAIPSIKIGVGCHPHNASEYSDAIEAKLRSMLKDSRVACIGEIGLDYHYDISPRDEQRCVFARQIQIAHELQMPIALHVREAHKDALAILNSEGFPKAGVLLHCCSLTESEIEAWIDADCYIAYGGPITFNGLDEARVAAAKVPLNRLLTETDSPYMTPVPLRGIECLPDYVGYNADVLAEVVACARGISCNEAKRAFLHNAQEFLHQGPFPCQCL